MMVETIRLPAAPEALTELSEILYAAAGGMPHDRESASRYILCRQSVIAAMSRRTLPGFLTQCGSLAKFIDFITLYHWDPSLRQALVVEAFGHAPHRGSRPSARGVDFFDDPF